MNFPIISLESISVEEVLSFFKEFSTSQVSEAGDKITFLDFFIKIDDFTQEVKYAEAFAKDHPSVPLNEINEFLNEFLLNVDLELLIDSKSFFFKNESKIADIICIKICRYFQAKASIQLGDNEPYAVCDNGVIIYL